MQPRNVALVGVVGITIGWLLASTMTPPVARVQTRPPERERQAAIPDASFTEQLQLRLRRAPPPPDRRRNPFVFDARDRARTVEIARESPDATETTSAAPARPGPGYVLSGIGISGETRTAVLTTTGDDVHIVKVDDEIGGYRVVEIGENAVTLSKGDERVVLRFPSTP
jgi:hypothetical protein